MVDEATFRNFSWVGDDESGCGYRFYADGMWPGGDPSARNFSCRRQYQAMLHNADARVGAIEDALVKAGLWDQTLMTFMSDNGGSIDHSENAASNYPLKGGKYSPWEGGIRVTSFWSGGFLPAASRGTTVDGLVHIADYFLTLCKLAGLSETLCRTDAVAEAAGLPPIAGFDIWPLVSGANATSPRLEVPVDTHTLLVSDGDALWKYMDGKFTHATWVGPTFPNASGADPAGAPVEDCTAGCLFDVRADETEHNNVAAANPAVVAKMSARLAELVPNFYSNSDTGGTDLCPKGTQDCMCWAAKNLHSGFLGPWHQW